MLIGGAGRPTTRMIKHVECSRVGSLSQNLSIMRPALRSEINEHRFKVGQVVQYYPPRGIYAHTGAYHVTAELPSRAGEFEYRIRHPREAYERVAAESALTSDPG
jgi:hypothetical protein